jgi:parvulin-like peptidyl-prolyl isomerase
VPIATRKHIARAERERRLRRWILIGTVITGLLVLGILVYGILDLFVIRPSQPVLVVNGDKITTSEFQARVRLRQRDLYFQYQNALQMQSLLSGENPQFEESVQQQISDLQASLSNPLVVGQEIINQFIQEILIRQEAQRRGLEVGDAEVESRVQELFGYYPEGTPTPLPTRTPDAARTATAMALPTATPIVSPTAGPSPTASPTFAPSPTPTSYTAEAYEQNLQSFVESLEEFDVRKRGFYAAVAAQLYQEKLIAVFEQAVAREQLQVHLKHIQVEDEESAQEIKQMLDEGEDWASLVEERSLDTGTVNIQGDLGWLLESQVQRRFGEQATEVFDFDAGEISKPVESQAGWHIFHVVEKEVRALSDSVIQNEGLEAFNAWLTEATDQAEIQIEDYWIERVPSPPILAS